ncbi:MAG: metallophosphoesterase family protein [Spirochaetota bacterium]|nr:MAG: metallophosphoesterase family protein [Spirochaetota bacterium]
MRILAIADKKHRALYDYFEKERWKDIDLILSCGDLDKEYLGFLVTLISVPLLYIPGNHDRSFLDDPPGGCDSLDGRVVKVKGITISGLGGCMWYNGEGVQYKEKEMLRKVRRIMRKSRRMGGIDIFVAHAPPKGIHDLDDQCHQGFQAFKNIIEELHPSIFIHGHNHEVHSRFDRETVIDGVRVINAYGYHCFDI